MKQKNPTVSILLPIGKDKRFLNEALESVWNQTFKDYELLTQEDDGRRITQVLIDLAKKAKGEFLVRMDADDICLPNRLKVQMDYLRANPDVQLAGSWATLIDENGNWIGLQKMPIHWEEIKKEVFFRNPLIHPSWMMRKSWFKKAGGYNSAFATSQDWELLLRRVWQDRVENIPESLIKLRIHSGSVSFSNNRQQVFFGLKARLETIFRGDVPYHKIIFLFPTALALLIPAGFKLAFRKMLISGCRPARQSLALHLPATLRAARRAGALAGGSAVFNEKILGLVMPIGQNKEQLLKSGQWSLWQSEIEEYRKYFDGIELFEFKHRDWLRFPEAKLLPFVQSARFKRCSVLKAVHLSAAIPCLVAKALYGIPYVFSFGYRYDEFTRVEKKWIQWIFVKLFEPLAVRFADLVLVPTKELGKYVKSLGAKNIEVVPNGVNPEIFKGPARQLAGRALSDLRILFVGRLELQKNLKTLIQAVFRISKDLALSKQGQVLINIRFVGAGSQKEELVKFADKLGVNLEITERVPNEKLPEIYRQADIFVLPSLAEGHPKALLEAMSCDLACIASNISGVNGIIVDNENGLLVEPTVNGFVKGLERLIGDFGLRQRLGRCARKTVIEKFDKKKLMESESRLLLSIK